MSDDAWNLTDEEFEQLENERNQLMEENKLHRPEPKTEEVRKEKPRFSKEEQKQNSEKKKPITTSKYSRLGKGELHESVILGGVPRFLRYDKENDKMMPLKHIEEETRILRHQVLKNVPTYPTSSQTQRSLKPI
jgi:hypothetical protein